MKKIGLVGEHPHDTDGIANLLLQRFEGKADFFSMLRDIRGSMLDSQKTKHLLRKAKEKHRPDVVIFVRDLDAPEYDRSQKLLRQTFFNDSNRVVDECGIFLLNIETIEALIFSDIEAFNDSFGAAVQQVADPMLVEKPCEKLKATGKYTEGDCPKVMKALRIDIVAANCRYFAAFLSEFEKRIA